MISGGVYKAFWQKQIEKKIGEICGRVLNEIYRHRSEELKKSLKKP